MSGNPVIKVENLSKKYRLGQVGTGTLSHDLNRWWHSIRGKEDPYLKVGETNDRASKGESEYAWALQDINFEVQQGEVLGIIGKNGAGKSTLLKILSKVTGPTTGSIKAKGRIASLLEVGTGFHPELTGRENIYLNGTILGMTKAEVSSKLEEIVDFAGVERYLDTPVKRYSSGMKVRLGFAVAAHLEPEILIVDEVLAVGDAEFQKKAVGKIKEVSGKDGRTVLFVSHNMASINNLCSRGLLLNDGKLLKEADIKTIISTYINIPSLNISASNLGTNTNRKGNGKIKFTEAFITNDLNNKSNVVSSGKDAFICLTLENTNKKIISDIAVIIAIKDYFGNRITTFHSRFSGFKIDSIKNRKKIVCRVKDLPLVKGTYVLLLRNLIGASSKLNGAEVGDYLESAINFEVIEGDFFNSGKIPDKKKHGMILMKHDWLTNKD